MKNAFATRSRLLLGAWLICLIAGGLLASPAAAAPSWLAPVNLSTAGHSSAVPQVAFDPAGDAVAVWRSINGPNFIIQAATRQAGGTWQAPIDLSVAGHDAYAPQVALDPAGNAVAVWERFDGANYIVQAASRPAGGAWQAPVDLSTAGHSSGVPQVALDQAGNAVAVWYRSNGTNNIVQAASRPAGGTWQAPVDLSAAGQTAEAPQVSLDPAGDAVAVWCRSNGTNKIVQAASRPAGGTWQAPVDLSIAGQDANTPQVALDPAGNAVAVWRRYDGAKYIIQSASRSAGGTWQAPVDVSVAGQSAYVPQVSLDLAGNAVAVWERYDGANYVVQSATRAAGGAWQAPVVLSATGDSGSNPQVSLDPAGDAVAVWERGDGAKDTVQSATRSAGGAWQAPVDLSATGQTAEFPQVSLDPAGNAVAVWERYNGADYIVQGAGYDAAGPQLRSLSIPAAGVVGQPLSFSVSPLDVWSTPGLTAWSFGDGAGAVGTSAGHTYAAPGAYTVTVTASDVLGNAGSASGTVTISAARGAGGGANGRGGGAKAKANRIVAVKGGKALVALSCPAGGSCAGVAKLLVPAKGAARASAGHRAKSIGIGKAPFRLAAGKRKTVKVPLTKRGRALVAAAGREGLKARLGGSGLAGRAVVLEPAAVRHHPGK